MSNNWISRAYFAQIQGKEGDHAPDSGHQKWNRIALLLHLTIQYKEKAFSNDLLVRTIEDPPRRKIMVVAGGTAAVEAVAQDDLCCSCG